MYFGTLPNHSATSFGSVLGGLTAGTDEKRDDNPYIDGPWRCSMATRGICTRYKPIIQLFALTCHPLFL